MAYYPPAGKYLKGSIEPVAGISVGFVLTWLITFFVHPPENSNIDISLQLFSLQFIIFCWAVSMAATGKSLHGGGLHPASKTTQMRYGKYIPWLLPLEVIIVLAISKGSCAIGMSGIALVTSMMMAEMLFGRAIFWLRYFSQVWLHLMYMLNI